MGHNQHDIRESYFFCIDGKQNVPMELLYPLCRQSTWCHCLLVMFVTINCFVFDSHSRNSYGIPVANGTSVLMMFPTRQKIISYLHTLYSLSQCSTDVKYQVPTDVFLMCHIEFHMINCGVEKYFSDQHYLSFCSDHHRKLEQSNNKSEESKTCKGVIHKMSVEKDVCLLHYM